MTQVLLAAIDQRKSFGILLARAGCPDGPRHCFENHRAPPGEGDQIAMLLASVDGAVPDRQIVKLYDQRALAWDRAKLAIRAIGS